MTTKMISEDSATAGAGRGPYHAARSTPGILALLPDGVFVEL